MDLIQAIQSRHSVRKYTDKPIEDSKLATLRKAIEKVNSESGLNIQLVVNEPKGFNGFFISTYGQFSGVMNYIVMAATKGNDWEEKVGYYGEKLVPAWFLSGVEAALLAPTAVNQQKFKFILHDGNKVSTKTSFSLWGYTQIDMGIVKYHFEIGAGKDNFEWV